MDHHSLISQQHGVATARPWWRGPALARVIGRPQGGLILGPVLAGLLILWAILGGGYDAGVWYPSALALLGLLAAVLVAGRAVALPRALVRALVLLGAYVAWSYLSILWAGSPGDALEGSNRALLYLIVFALAAAGPWSARGALAALGVLSTGIGVVALVILARLATGSHVSSLLLDGRLSAPTGYFNASVALFTMGALLCLTLSLHRSVPLPVRAVLSAMAAACLQLAVTGQSRGWLLTLPVIVLAAVAIVPARLRLSAAAVPPALAALVPVHTLTGIFDAGSGPALVSAAEHAGTLALVLCTLSASVVLSVGAVYRALAPGPLSRPRRRAAGAAVCALALVGAGLGASAATHGHPLAFAQRQWHGFTQPVETDASGSHFATVGSGRYDFWRVSLQAVAAHPIGGLGQDNFADYYITRRRTTEQPSWTHSLEMRLLVHTGIVGLVLFAGFLICALAPALRAVRRRDGTALLAATALMPLLVWLIHGSVDWFWEFPALSGPALAGLALAGRIAPAGQPIRGAERTWPRWAAGLGVAGLLAAALALGVPYLAQRELSTAGAARAADPAGALAALRTASRLDPLSAAPGRLGGTIALQTGREQAAADWFAQAVAREPGGWYGWLGAGLAASALGHRASAERDFVTAGSIDRGEPAIEQALAHLRAGHPLRPVAALDLLTLAH
jgi:hypothetical protein